MAKRLVCCPSISENEGLSLRYLYVDTLALCVEDVTDSLAVFDDNLRNVCCLDKLVDYANGSKLLDKSVQATLPFDFYELNSFELFRNPEELRLKTGSEKILYSCLLSYYRREYDGTQQHTFFSEPAYNAIHRDGIEHELTLETRTFIKKEQEEFVPETLDKGKSLAEREAEAAEAQALSELEQALAEEEAKALKKETADKNRKKARERVEAEAYRDLRNQDNIHSEQYQRLRRHEEEMRANNDYLASQYDNGNYSSLPGYIAPATFAAKFESIDNETVRCTCGNNDLFALASRLDEFGIDYTVISEQAPNGEKQSTICYTSDQAANALRAIEFFELEKQLYADRAIPANTFLNAFQLQALDYAYANCVDTSFVNSGNYSSNQMYRIVEAGLDGRDMSVLANPSYTPAQMDALNYFMRNTWDTTPISDPGLPMAAIADCIFREEQTHGVADSSKFFASRNYDDFVSYRKNNSFIDYSNSYDESHRKQLNLNYESAQQGAKTLRDYKDVAYGSPKTPQNENRHAPGPYGQERTAAAILPSPSGSPLERPPAVSDAGKPNKDTVPTQASKTPSGGAPSPVTGRDGRSYFKETDGTLRDANGNRYVLDKNGYPKPLNSYSFGAEYTPTGYTRSDSSYSQRPASRRQTPSTPDASRSSDDTTHRNAQKTPSGQKLPDYKKHPLDELKVRSSFADRAGMRIQRFGSQALQIGGQFARQSAFLLVGNITSSDETNTLSTGYHYGRNAIFTAQLVRDLPMMFAKPGQGISYTSVAVQNAGKSVARNAANSQECLPLRTKPWEEKIAAVQKEHYNSLVKDFGRKAASFNMKEIEKQILVCGTNLSNAREKVIPVNQQLKAELKAFHPSAKLTVEKRDLISENRKLKADIKALQSKESLSPHEEQLLAKKIKKKSRNEQIINRKSKVIKEKGPADEKTVKKYKELLEKKKHNEAVLAKHGRKLKGLNNLKKRKLNFEEDLKNLTKNLKAAQAAEGRLHSIPGMFANKLVQKLYQSGDITLSGIGQATSYAMSFSQSSITRMLYHSLKKYVQKKKQKKNETPQKKKPDAPTKPASQNNRHAKPQSKPQKPVSGLTNRTKTTVGIKGEKPGKQLFNQSKSVKTWIKQTANKIAESAKAAVSAIKGLFGATSGGAASGAAAAGGAAAAAAGGAAAAPVLLIILIILLVIVLIAVILFSCGVFSSFIVTDEEDKNGKIDLTHYVEFVNNCQSDLQIEINDIAAGKSSETGKPYDNIFYDYTGTNNTLQILSMAYVRFGYDLSDKEAVEAYIEQLYQDSNFVEYAESDLYSCANGCVEREYYCYDKPDKYATNTRRSLYAASDHSDYALVGEKDGSELGCKYESYSCMEKGHGTYNKNGCSLHNDGKPMLNANGCDNYKTRIIPTIRENGKLINVTYYYCQGHCSGKHRDYYCPGHKETVCYGEHQDITITITSLGFDDIFYADSALTAVGSYAKGSAYKEKFTVTAYCSCHECCHPYDPACTGKPAKTASGTTPKANHTIAVDPDVIPLGTHVWINGKEYVAEDTGGAIDGHRIDIYFENHQEALNWGKRKLTVYKSYIIAADTDGKDPYGFDGWTEENIELVKTIYDNLTNDDADEIYVGLNGINSLSYGGYTGSYDFSGLEFDEVDTSSLTKHQKAVLSVIKANKAETQKGYCQAWVADVYMYAGTGARASKCCANHAGEAWGVSNDWSKIQVGATVYGYSSSQYGHVGIYIGDGKVAHNIGYVKIESLESWVKTYNGQCWGWNGGYNLTGRSTYNCKASGTFMKGKD